MLNGLFAIHPKILNQAERPSVFNKNKPPVNNFNWFDELINAGILAGLTFVSSISVTSGNVIIGIKVGIVTSALTFLTRLALKRNIN